MGHSTFPRLDIIIDCILNHEAESKNICNVSDYVHLPRRFQTWTFGFRDILGFNLLSLKIFTRNFSCWYFQFYNFHCTVSFIVITALRVTF